MKSLRATPVWLSLQNNAPRLRRIRAQKSRAWVKTPTPGSP
jgi:hypothetical protein